MVLYFCMLKPRRATFMQDMTPAERDIMLRHVAYWSELAQKRVAVAFGPVPAKGFGVGIIEVPDEPSLRALIADDPGATINDYEYHLMPRAIARA